jgi:hypothetical protein
MFKEESKNPNVTNEVIHIDVPRVGDSNTVVKISKIVKL